jgi:hypothetical protein
MAVKSATDGVAAAVRPTAAKLAETSFLIIFKIVSSEEPRKRT